MSFVVGGIFVTAIVSSCMSLICAGNKEYLAVVAKVTAVALALFGLLGLILSGPAGPLG